MKVRGFQVAPAELEGHLLTHPDVVDVCVIPLLDDYSGEIPRAYVVLSDPASRRISGNAHAALELKAVIAKVCGLTLRLILLGIDVRSSTLQMRRYIISI